MCAVMHLLCTALLSAHVQVAIFWPIFPVIL